MDYRYKSLLCQPWLYPIALALASTLVAAPLEAQTPPPQPPFPRTPQLPLPQDVQPSFPALPSPAPEIPQQLPPPEQLLQPPQTTPTPPEENIPGVPQTITVEKFVVVGSTVFSPDQLAKVLAPYTNRPISFAELFQARSAVTQLYFDNGYITSGAYIPPQALEGKVVQIQVLEGGLEGIQVTGTRSLNPSYVRSRVVLGTDTPLNRDRLLEALQLLQLNPLIANISAELSAGTRPGQSLLEITVLEEKTSTFQFALDNGRSPAVGSFRRRIQANEANLFGQGDSVSLAYTNTDGSSSFDASYSYPLNPRNGTLNLAYGTTSSNVIEPPFDLQQFLIGEDTVKEEK